MIDIHTHILPGIDDGSPSLDDSLNMADIAASSGVDTIIMTPHCNIPDYYDNYYSLELMHAFSDFKKALEQFRIPVQVLPGMEIFATPDISSLIQEKKVIGLNFSQYILVEFNFGENAEWMSNRLQEIIKIGRIPIVAHPERYDCISEQPEITVSWIQMGCLLQCNKGSFLGSFGRRVEETSHHLLNHRLVSFIASDTHHPDVRTPHMSEIYNYIASQYSERTALRLMHDNPLSICTKRPITMNDYIPFESKSYWSF